MDSLALVRTETGPGLEPISNFPVMYHDSVNELLGILYLAVALQYKSLLWQTSSTAEISASCVQWGTVIVAQNTAKMWVDSQYYMLSKICYYMVL